MKKSLLSMVIIMLSACSPSPETPTTGQESPPLVQTEDKSPSHSKYTPYSQEEVEIRLNSLKNIVENDHLFLPAFVKEAQSYLDNWDKHPEALKAMMEADLDPTNPDNSNDIPMETMEQSLNVRANIHARESQSAFNLPGAIEYILQIQSTEEQNFVLQALKVNKGHCGFYTADFKSKLPVNMRYSSTVSYLLQCRGDQVIDIELITDRGNFSLNF